MRLHTVLTCFLIGASGTVYAQTPTIRTTADGVVNNASYAPSGLPNSSIAQGSIFAIFGSNLGGGTLAQQQSYPLSKTLNGTSVKVTVGGTAVDAIPIYTVASQIGVVLPSNTPTGTGTVTVTYNGQTSAPHAITVVPSSFGAFSLNQQGTGPAVITDANYVPITLTNSAKPGQPLILWGTGLGKGLGDDTAAPVTGNLQGLKVDLYVGGLTAPVSYAGRSGCCSGLDQIVFTVPAGVSGCNVSVIVVANDTVPSNTTTMSIGPNGGTCSDTNGLSQTDLTGILSGSNLRLGVISVGRSTTQTPAVTIPNGPTVGGGTTTSDSASAVFEKYTPQQIVASQGVFRQASIGSCIVSSFTGSSPSMVDPVMPAYLDAGPAITMTGGTSMQTLTRDATLGFYLTATPSTGSQTFIPSTGGTFNFTNGSGGADVGALQNASITLGAPITWTNMDQITTVPRTSDLLITWSGGNAGTYVEISGSSIIIGQNAASSLIVLFSCTAPVAAGRFSVPRAVLLQLPASSMQSAGGVSIPTGSLSVGNYANPMKFTATGLDAGYLSAYVTSGKSVTYQ